MRSIPLAMTWELLNHRPWTLIAGVLGANLMPVLVLTALRQEGGIEPADSSMIIMHVVLTQMNLFIFGAAVFSAQGNPSRLYAWPLSTSTIVTWHLFLTMIIIAIESLISTALLNSVFHLGWPLWGPAMFVAVGVAAVQSVFWLMEKSAWLAVGVALVGGVLGIWFKSRYGAPLSPPQHYWLQLNPSEVATMLIVAGLAYGTAIAAVARNRRSEPPVSLGIVTWLDTMLNLAPEIGPSFRTPAQAQFWFEWQRKGWVMPAGVVFGILMGCCTWLIFSRDPEMLFVAFIVGGGLLSVLGLIGGLMMGNSGPNDANYDIGPFLATRPMTTPELARTLLKVAARSVLLAWFIWATAFLAVYLILLAIGFSPGPEFSDSLRWWYFPVTLVGAWMAVALVASIGLTGRSELFTKLLAAFLVLSISLSLLFRFVLSDQAQEQFIYGATTVSGVVFLLATTWLFVAAHRRLLIGWPTAYVAASMWGALCALVAMAWVRHPAESLPIYILFVGLAALAVAPLAAAPLALAWNRHR